MTIDDAEELAAALPPDRLRLERFPDAGRMLAAEHPEAVLNLIREFVLEEPEQRQRPPRLSLRSLSSLALELLEADEALSSTSC